MFVRETREYLDEADDFIGWNTSTFVTRLTTPVGTHWSDGIRLVLAPVVSAVNAIYMAFRSFLVWNWVLPAAVANVFVDEQVRRRGERSMERTITLVAVLLRILLRSVLVVIVYALWMAARSAADTPDWIADSYLWVCVVAIVGTSVGVTARRYRGVLGLWVRGLLLLVASLPVLVVSPFLVVIGTFAIVVLPPAQLVWFVVQHLRLGMSELTWNEPNLVRFMHFRPAAYQRAWAGPPLYSIWFANILNDSDGLSKERPVVVVANDESRRESVVMYFTSQEKRDGTLGYEEFGLRNATKRNFLNTRDTQKVSWDDLRITDLSMNPEDMSRLVTIAARRTVL